VKAKIAAIEKVKQIHCNKKEAEVCEYKALKDQLGNDQDFSFNEPIQAIDFVEAEEVSVTPLESVQEVLFKTPLKSVKEVKKLYELNGNEMEKG
jgi:hypothetical protein